eukprot:Rhum_TRINITY_DN16928_c0_g1::Rhum_TRINITY_DN16928_c0_g1_i1::g.164737::m.164737/K15014/SLC29A1_2_3, ENT1_2_3; solute carrier family 29 (equilibrative nucleoside transporter), member 1/2/3
MSGDPTDTFSFVLVSLWICGAGVLFPWNAFISAPDYFTKFHEYVDPHTELSHGEKRMWDNISTYFTTGFSVLNIIGQAMILVWNMGNISTRIIWSIIGMFVIVLVVPVLSYFKMSATLAFYLLVSAASLCGFFTAFFQSTIFGLGAMFPQKFTQSVMIGNASAGLAVSLIRIVTKASGGTPQLNGAIYMYLAAAWLVVSVACFVFLRKLRFAQKFVEEFEVYKRIVFDGDSVTTVGSTHTPAVASQYSCAAPAKAHDSASVNTSFAGGDDACVGDGEGDILLATDEAQSIGVFEVFKRVAPMAFTVFLTLMVSITLFPGVTAKIPSKLSDGWFTIWLITLYNLGDNIGRIMPRFYKAPHNVVVLLGVLRLGFVPMLILCVHVFTEPQWPVLLMLGMSTSNGYVASLCMMYGPDHPDLSVLDRGVAGNIMSFALLLGITAGSFIGLLICNYLPSDGSDSGSGST